MDDYDMLDEKQEDVAIITPAESPEESAPEPAANDCESQRTRDGSSPLIARR
jgi:hypothetical protein